MSYHDCSGYAPKHAKIGDTYQCICGVEYELVRKFPWKKWEQIKDDFDKCPFCDERRPQSTRPKDPMPYSCLEHRNQAREKYRNIVG